MAALVPPLVTLQLPDGRKAEINGQSAGVPRQGEPVTVDDTEYVVFAVSWSTHREYGTGRVSLHARVILARPSTDEP